MNLLAVSLSDPFPLLQLTLKVTLLLSLFFALWMLARHKSASFRHRILVLAVGSLPCLLIAEWLLPSRSLPLLEPQAISQFETAMDYVGRSEPVREIVVPDQPAIVDTCPQLVLNPSNDLESIAKENICSTSEVDRSQKENVGLQSEQAGSSEDIDAMPAVATDDKPSNWSARSIILTVWLTGFVVLASRFFIAWFVVWSHVCRCPVVQESSLDPKLASLLKEFRQSCVVFRMHRANGQMPLCFGLLKPTVLLPREFADWETKEQRSVVLHETAHAVRRDCLVNVFAHFQASILWFHPMSWLLLRLLKTESEMACDDWALSQGVDNVNYASALYGVTMSTRRKPTVAIVSVSMADCSPLERRMRSILSTKVQRGPISWAAQSMVGTVSLALIGLLSTFHIGPVPNDSASITESGTGDVAKTQSSDRPSIQVDADSDATIEHLVELKDNQMFSCSLAGSLNVETDFGSAQFSFDKIRSLKSMDDGKFQVLTRDGSVIQGDIQQPQLRLGQQWGANAVDVSQIRKVTTIGNARLTPGQVNDGFLRDGISYHVRAPLGYDPSKKYPAIVFFHDAESNSRSMIEQFVAKAPAMANDTLLVGINGENRSSRNDASFNYTYIDFAGRSDKYKGFPGTDRQSPALVTESITALKDRIPVSNVYVVGEGSGAFLSLSVLMNFPELVDGVVAINGGLLIQCAPDAYENSQLIAQQKATPLWVMHASPNQGSFATSYTSSAYSAFMQADFENLKLTTSDSLDDLPIEKAIGWMMEQ